MTTQHGQRRLDSKEFRRMVRIKNAAGLLLIQLHAS